MSTTARRTEPEGWLLRIRTIGPGAVHRSQRKAKPGRAGKPPRKGLPGPDKPGGGTIMDEPARKQVVVALSSTIERYPFGLLAARVGSQEIDLVLRCPSTDLPLVADLVKRQLMNTIREAGLAGRFWRKGFLRRALGTQGDLRRALNTFRRDARERRAELLDRVRNDPDLGIRSRRPHPPIE